MHGVISGLWVVAPRRAGLIHDSRFRRAGGRGIVSRALRAISVHSKTGDMEDAIALACHMHDAEQTERVGVPVVN